MEDRDKISLLIIIVNWNTRELLRQALRSLLLHEPSIRYEIVVIDNASQDGSPEMVETEFPKVSLIREQENLGFAKAVNIGFTSVDAEYYLLLNSDCVFIDEIMGGMINFMKNNGRIGILAPLLLYADGSLQSSGEPPLSAWTIFRSQILFSKSPWRMKHRKLPKKGFFEAGFVSGACMLIRSNILKEVGLFREEFFMYGEDVDFCMRARQAGWKVGVGADYSVIHLKAKTTINNLSETLKNSVINNCRLIFEQQGRLNAELSFIFYFFGIGMRSVIAFMRRNQQATEWLKLWRLLPGLRTKIYRGTS